MFCAAHADRDVLAASVLKRCGACYRQDHTLVEEALRVHARLRSLRGLVSGPKREGKYVCPECGNHCRLNEGEVGFCGLYMVHDGKVVERYQNEAIVSWYFDPLPTNCVADWVCPVTTKNSLFLGKYRLKNLAVFYGSCNSDCLFCQNDSYKDMMAAGRPRMTPEELAAVSDSATACVCFFGGDPACNARHSLEVARRLNEDRLVRVCYETNGNISSKWLNRIADVVESTGGTIKFDLKAYSPEVYTALTGVRNDVVLRNFRRLAQRGRERDGEFLVASILLVPGYLDLHEIRLLCEFIASCDTTIPTALLGFAPHHHMRDLPRTSRTHAERAHEVAMEVGLTNVRVGNVGLLSDAEYNIE